MSNDRGDKPEQRPVEGKRPWVDPAIAVFAARDADVSGNPYGGTDLAIYSS